MFKTKFNILLQCLMFTFLWQIILFTLYVAELITYNPLIELSDIIPNYFFIFFMSTVLSSPLFSFFLIFIIYILGVTLYYFTRQNITFAQLSNFPELVIIYSPISFILIILLLFFIYHVFKVTRKLNLIIQKKKVRFFQICICSVIFLFIGFGTTIYFPKISKHNTENFNKFATWKHGGQLYSIIYHYADRRNTIKRLNQITSEIFPTLKFETDPKSKIFMIILLESFVPRSVLQPEKYETFLKDYGFKSKILESPAYGGYSAKSEFEILCGVPELQPFGDMSFNYLGSKEVDFCLPSLISAFEYKTISITGTSLHFHNAKNAYQALGFDESISKKDLDKNDFDGNHPSDKTIFAEAYNKILNKKNDKLFLYVFTAAGHDPYSLNKKNRPRLSDDLYFDRVTYTEKELKEFLGKLDQLGINTSILIASDHATERSNLKNNTKLLNVWFKSNDLNDLHKDCSQYFQIPKYFTGQKCENISKYENDILDRGKNFPNYYKNNDLILGLIKKSR